MIKFKKSIQKIPEIFHKLELLLTKTDTPFFGGTSFNAVDISLVPFLCLYLMANEFNKELILPKKESKLYLYIKNIQDHKFLNELIFSDNKLKTDIKEELLFESEETITIKSSSRNLIENIESEVQSMNKRISLKSKRNSPILWTKGNNEKGPFIETSILFKNAEEAFSALQTICELQESSDHHAHFVLENFSQIKVEVCTHQPKWGVTAMDIAFAETLSNRI